MNHRVLLLPILLGAAAAICPAEPTLLDHGYRQMYDLDFPGAHKTFQEWQSQHPTDPMGPASDAAAYLFAEFDRLHILESEFFTHDQHFITDNKLTPDPAVKAKFFASLQNGRNLAARTPNDKNAMFASVLCSGLESDYLALIEKRYGASFQQMKAGRVIAEKLLAMDPTLYDAWIAVGLENYMLSIKPAPVRFLLRLGGGQTNGAVGLEKLRLTAAKGRYLAPFARLLLAVAALREHNNSQARDLLAGLSKEFPHNHLYIQELSRIEPIAFRSGPQ